MLRLYNIISIPTLIVHELLHIMTCIIVMSSWTGIKVTKLPTFHKTYAVKFEVFTVSKYKFQNTVIHLSPLLALLIPFFILPYDLSVGLFVLSYQLTTIRLVLPSRGDIEAIKTFKSLNELYMEQNKKTPQ